MLLGTSGTSRDLLWHTWTDENQATTRSTVVGYGLELVGHFNRVCLFTEVKPSLCASMCVPEVCMHDSRWIALRYPIRFVS